MNKIDELIRWYGENETRREYRLIQAKLKLIKSLHKEIEASDDRLFVSEIIQNFAAIMDLQQDVIADKEMELEVCAASTGSDPFDAYMQQGGFREDKQLQTAFTAFLSDRKKKPLSSYTINDYCSRIRKLWKSFYTAYQKGLLEEPVSLDIQHITPENPLINAYFHVDELQDYAQRAGVQPKEKRNWANTCAALNKFAEFVKHCR